jgi:uncharacterized membrane protein
LNIFPWKKKKNFFTAEEQQLIIDAIHNAERMTSGEVRVFVESKCSYMDAIDRAAELFFQLEMQKTDDRNAVLSICGNERQATCCIRRCRNS